MKKLIIYILCVLICAFSGLFIYKKMQASPYEQTAVPYIKEVLPLISTWQPELLDDYMATEVLERVLPSARINLMETLSRIGELEKIDKVQFKYKSAANELPDVTRPVVTYQLDTLYSSGEVKVTISLLDKGDGAFSVYRFNFQSEALTP